MKRLNYFIGAALAIAAAVSCNKEPEVVDFPIVGDFTLYGESAEGTWAKNTSVGVFVTSDGVAQTNLEYTPASTEATGSVQLNAKSEKAGFKQGNHVVYAYYPYVATAEGNTVVLGDLTSQNTKPVLPDMFKEWENDPSMKDFLGMLYIYNTSAPVIYAAKKEVKEYSSAPIDLGVFAPVAVTISVAEPGLTGEEAESLVGKKVEKIVLSSNKTIAYKDTKYDVVSGKIIGTEGSNSIEVITNNAVYSMSMVNVNAFNVATCLTKEDLTDAKFTIEVYIEGNKKYAAVDYTANSNNQLVNVALNPAN